MFSGVISWVNQFALYILIGVIVLLLIFGAAQTVRLKLAVSAKEVAIAEKAIVLSQLQSQVAVVTQLAKQGEELVERVRTFQQEAVETRRKNQALIDILTREVVPVKCEEAMKWGALKAQSLSSAW